ncbi:TrmH family RNA methyltransferase [Wenyingzhuangia sp. 1_MG-2023]|nr:TrmH family RNA methyltransferase [Wenyingzhuangia sp. 1_MG-2023]
MEQLAHESIKKRPQTFPIVVIADELRTPQNVGMCLRVCEAFGVSKFYRNYQSPDLDNRMVQRTARNTDKYLEVQAYENTANTIVKLKTEGYTVLALEITNSSKNIHQYNFTKHSKIALLIGSERFGIDPDALLQCDGSIDIAMFGLNSSMNVVNSLSVCLYEITKQLNTTKNTLS